MRNEPNRAEPCRQRVRNAAQPSPASFAFAFLRAPWLNGRPACLPLPDPVSNVTLVASNLFPIFLILFLGWVMRATALIGEPEWQGFEKVCYYLFFPAIIIMTLAKTSLADAPFGQVGGALVTGIAIMVALLLVLRKPILRWADIDDPSFTSLFQGSTRWNTFVGIALAVALFGPEGLSLVAVAIAAMIPLLNILSIVILMRFGRPDPAAVQRPVLATLLRSIALNPFVWSCAIGIGLNLAGLRLPGPLMAFGDMMAQPALAGGLLVVGAGLDLRRLARPRRVHWLSLGTKLVLMPVLVGSAALLLGATGPALAVAMIAASVPAASASYIFARAMGGDAPLMAEILTMQVLAAMVTMPLWIWIAT